MAVQTAAVAADCKSRVRTKLPAFPDVLTDQTILLFEDGTFVVEYTLNQRHILQPGFISPLCPGNADGVIVVADRSKNIAGAAVKVENDKIDITFKLRDPKKQTFTLFVRFKYQEDKGLTGQDKPRKLALETFPLGSVAVGKRAKTNSTVIPEE